MNIKVKDFVVSKVVTTLPHKSIGHVKDIMRTKKIHSIPIVGSAGEPLGIVTAKDFIADLSDNTPVSKVMSDNIHTIPLYADISIAARMMRNKKIHHLIVTDEKRLVGIISTFDLIQLVEGKRFIMKNPPTKSKKSTKRA
jgi:CBS domain-containing protein